jgi:hypothetical protein
MNNTTSLDPRIATVREYVARVAAIGSQLGAFALPWAG